MLFDENKKQKKKKRERERWRNLIRINQMTEKNALNIESNQNYKSIYTIRRFMDKTKNIHTNTNPQQDLRNNRQHFQTKKNIKRRKRKRGDESKTTDATEQKTK